MLSADSAAVAERVEDENCNGDMESMEMEMDAEVAADHPATSADADVPCSQPPAVAASAASTSTDVHSLNWSVFCAL